MFYTLCITAVVPTPSIVDKTTELQEHPSYLVMQSVNGRRNPLLYKNIMISVLNFLQDSLIQLSKPLKIVGIKKLIKSSTLAMVTLSGRKLM
ncbi:9728_t:CDS:2 [Dentiscutata heterogama]|uniref:9728_t:CDS:1 n=1 Tax=Dentiscutata heterogama TaxID=1316150 RepID=A0ACA9LYM6_9GLOM|nr:9728_t:CDS:2 [Dentiscutata heterogama]